MTLGVLFEGLRDNELQPNQSIGVVLNHGSKVDSPLIEDLIISIRDPFENQTGIGINSISGGQNSSEITMPVKTVMTNVSVGTPKMQAGRVAP